MITEKKALDINNILESTGIKKEEKGVGILGSLGFLGGGAGQGLQAGHLQPALNKAYETLPSYRAVNAVWQPHFKESLLSQLLKSSKKFDNLQLEFAVAHPLDALQNVGSIARVREGQDMIGKLLKRGIGKRHIAGQIAGLLTGGAAIYAKNK